ncbi:hypothetical protein AMAG_10189 [Allomyces macrogynus ATCC 38327]|uniref:G-protein coupled receptors family 2 profile 2 domain-containing protein n=1 Tax=Allomyces macrogynus (strain ATCC 38327) TaxID=578462 RepID=A0A0L0SR45_ALLM3|nr:hypothetical protein AMAG_10189 [Allomyces macrogynus ATCC 38327]|eukprot:KNE64854.1 hypothetical protein AMAG_10189 [Allomyces macrogynus ATCC 38327]
MTFTSTQLDTLQVIARISASLSIVACVAIFADVIRHWPAAKYSPHRVILYWSFADLLFVLPISLAQLAIRQQWTTLCTVQAWVIQYSLGVAIFWGLFQSTNLALVIFRQFPTHRLHAIEWSQHLISWTVPAVVATLPFMIDFTPMPHDLGPRTSISSTANSTVTIPGTFESASIRAQLTIAAVDDERPPFYGDAVLWCWISNEYRSFRQYFLYIPLWLVFVYTILVYLVAGIAIIRPNTRWLIILSGRKKSSSSHGAGNPAASPTAATSAAAPPRTAPVLRLSSRARKHYIIRAMLYSFAFFLTWTGPTINRLHSQLHPDDLVFGLAVLHALTSPLQGFLNAQVYFSTYLIRACLPGLDAAPAADRNRPPGSPRHTAHGGDGVGVEMEPTQVVTVLVSAPTTAWRNVDSAGDAVTRVVSDHVPAPWSVSSASSSAASLSAQWHSGTRLLPRPPPTAAARDAGKVAVWTAPSAGRGEPATVAGAGWWPTTWARASPPPPPPLESSGVGSPASRGLAGPAAPVNMREDTPPPSRPALASAAWPPPRRRRLSQSSTGTRSTVSTVLVSTTTTNVPPF